jgi:hypothetical protein
MRKLAPLLAFGITFIGLAVFGVWWHRARMEASWCAIAAQVPATPLSATNASALPSNGWLFGFATGDCEVGHVVLGDGEVWRFAFASHHKFTGPDSYTVFRSHESTVRVRGGGFCCEVEFGDQKQPANTQEFIALLRSRGDDLEILSGR